MIDIYFGNPGCGKTTEAVKLSLTALRKRKRFKKVYDYAYCNFEQTAPKVKSCTLTDLGLWTFPQRSFVNMDESGIEYNNRFYKTLPKHTIQWFKLYRHYRIDLAFFSQSWEDMDVTIRRLADRLWHMRRIGPWTLIRRVYKYTMVDETTHQIIDGYKMASWLWLLVLPLQWLGIVPVHFRLTFRPFYYRFFDSYSVPNTPIREF